MDGQLIYKRWLEKGYSRVFDKMAYGKKTFMSILEDESGRIIKRRNIFLNGYQCQSQDDFWAQYATQIPVDSAQYFGRNLHAFQDAFSGGGPGFPGDCMIEIIGIDQLDALFGEKSFALILQLLDEADFVELIVESRHPDGPS